MMLEKVQGPDCPRCGCQDTEIARYNTAFGYRSAQRQCNACGCAFNAPASPTDTEDPGEADPADDAGVELPILRCPKCRAKRPRTLSSPLPIRYHECDACGHRFKSFEPEH